MFRHLSLERKAIIAAYPQHTSDPTELVTLADQALYRTKRAGRDRSETYVASLAN